MRKQLQPTKQQTKPFFGVALTIFILGLPTIWVSAIAFFPMVSWGLVLLDPEAPEN